MIKTLTGIGKILLNTALISTDVVIDVITLGGTMNDKEQPYTAKRFGKIVDDLEKLGD